MDMQSNDIMQPAHQAQVTFYLTGHGEGVEGVAGLGLRPALFAGYRDLTALRYDFPLVLLPDATDAGAVRSLTELFDDAIAACGEKDAARLRHHALRMERALRSIGGGRTNCDLFYQWPVNLDDLETEFVLVSHTALDLACGRAARWKRGAPRQQDEAGERCKGTGVR